MEESKLVMSDEDDRHAQHTQEKQPPKKKIGFCLDGTWEKGSWVSLSVYCKWQAVHQPKRFAFSWKNSLAGWKRG